MRTNKEIVKVISDLIQEKGWSVSELARRTNISKGSYSRYFNFHREFPLNKVPVVARVLNVTPEYILGTVDDPQHISKPTPDPEWQPTITAKDERDIEESLKKIKQGISEAYAASDGRGIHEYSPETQEAVLSGINFALQAMTLERKKRFTPNKHKQVKEDKDGKKNN